MPGLFSDGIFGQCESSVVRADFSINIRSSFFVAVVSSTNKMDCIYREAIRLLLAKFRKKEKNGKKKGDRDILYFLLISSDFFLASSKPFTIPLLTPFSSMVHNPAIVVPPGVQI